MPGSWRRAWAPRMARGRVQRRWGAAPGLAHIRHGWQGSAACLGTAGAGLVSRGPQERGGWGAECLLGTAGSGRNVGLKHAGSRVGMNVLAALHRARPPPWTPKPASCTPNPAPFTLHCAPQTLLSASCTSHSAPQNLQPTPCSLNPTPCIPNLAPCTSPAQTPTQMLLIANLHPLPLCTPYPESPRALHSLNPHTQKPICACWTPHPANPICGAHLPTVPSLLTGAAGAGGGAGRGLRAVGCPHVLHHGLSFPGSCWPPALCPMRLVLRLRLGVLAWAMPPALQWDSQLAQCTLGTAKLHLPRPLCLGDNAHKPWSAQLCLPDPSALCYGVSLQSASAVGGPPCPSSPHGTPGVQAVGMCTPVGQGVQCRPLGTTLCCGGAGVLSTALHPGPHWRDGRGRAFPLTLLSHHPLPSLQNSFFSTADNAVANACSKTAALSVMRKCQTGVSDARLEGAIPATPWGLARPGNGARRCHLRPLQSCGMGSSWHAVPGRCLLRGGPATSRCCRHSTVGHVCAPPPVLAGGSGQGPGRAAGTCTASLASEQRVLTCPPTAGTIWMRFPAPHSRPGSAKILAVGFARPPCIFFG